MTPNKGGVRSGAGRPKGRNTYGEATQPIRIPVSLLDPVDKLLQDFSRLKNSKQIDALNGRCWYSTQLYFNRRSFTGSSLRKNCDRGVEW